eukprot:scaffold3255_cov191-Ochromonas_danica.AAC.8
MTPLTSSDYPEIQIKSLQKAQKGFQTIVGVPEGLGRSTQHIARGTEPKMRWAWKFPDRRFDIVLDSNK